MMKYISLVVLAFALFGCKQDIDFVFPDFEELNLEIYGTGAPVKEQKIVPGTEKHNKLKEWVVNNKSGWASSMATYVPNVLVSGSGFSLNFRSKKVILNYKGGQFTKTSSQTEYEFLIENEKTYHCLKPCMAYSAML